MQNLEFPKCSEHGTLPLEFFCEQCSNFICRQCNDIWHKDHTTFGSLQRIQETQENLTSFLDAWEKEAKKAKEYTKELKKSVDFIKTPSSKELRKMKKQHKYVAKELKAPRYNEVKHVTVLREEKIGRLNYEIERLDQFSRSCENTYEVGRRLLEQTAEFSFTDEVKAFMTQNPLPVVVRPDAVKTLPLAVYKEPSSKQTEAHVDLSKHLRQHVLGFFIPRQPQQGETTAENVYQTDDLNFLSKTGPSTCSPDSCNTAYNSDVEQDDLLNDQPTWTENKTISAEFVSRTTTKVFRGSHLKTFSAAYLMGDSVWLCGWNFSMVDNKDFVLLNAKVPKYNTVLKRKRKDEKAELPTNMFPFEENIMFTKKGDCKVHGFHKVTNKFSTVIRLDGGVFRAVCSSDQFIFSLDSIQPNVIKIWNPTFQCCGKIPLDYGYASDAEIDMSFISDSNTPSHHSDLRDDSTDIDHTIVISASCPHGSVRAVSQMTGMIWQLDYQNCKDLDLRFNPCSVSASLAGDVYIADKGTNRVS